MNARTVACPKCYAPVGKECCGARGEMRTANHAERVAAATAALDAGAGGHFDAGWRVPVEPDWCKCGRDPVSGDQVICQRHRTIGLEAIRKIRAARQAS